MKRAALWFILALGLLGPSASGLNFRQVAYIPSGITWSYGYIKGGDYNHDGFQDLVFSADMPQGPFQVVYYGYRPFNRYVFQDTIGPSALFWDVGNLDGDSLFDIVTQKLAISRNSVGVFEAIDYWTVPKESVWAWRYEVWGNGVQDIYITDLDRDGLNEFLTADGGVVYVFENRGDNQYVKVYWDTTQWTALTPPLAYGDFDGDGGMEFARATYSTPPHMFIYECIGNDQYQIVWVDSLREPNNYDLITGPDLDGDGKLEIINGNNRTGPTPWAGKLWVYEATGNNQYAIIYADSVNGLNDRGVYCVHSDCGDVDRDGRPELVWAIDRDWMVYKSNGNNQFQRVFSAYGDNGHNTTNIHIHDMNGNGYPEIIESGGNETHIWEVEAAQVVYPNGGETLYWDSSCVIRFRNVVPFQADSFSLFFSSDSGLTYSPITHGIPGSDSTYLWTVPHVTSSNCFLMLWAYQNATGWDFSDRPFCIRDGTGVSDHPPSTIHHPLLPLRVSPNPFITYAQAPGYEKSSFSLYDVSGRKVGVYKGDRIGSGLSAGIYFLKPEGKESKPLRIVKLR